VTRKRIAEESWEELEDRFATTPHLSCWPKKEQRFLKNRCKLAMPRSNRPMVRKSCPDINQGLFQDDQVWIDAAGYYNPLSGPVVIRLEELMVISEKKRARPWLADRRIQVIGRKMEKFVPPVWKPRKKVDPGQRSSLIPTVTEGISIGLTGVRGAGSNVDTQSNLQDFPSQVEKGGTYVVRAEKEFYEHLWSCLARKGTWVRDNPPTLVWIRKELVDQRKFTERDCYPLPDGDTPSLVRECSLRDSLWRGERKPSILRIQRKCAMAEWNRHGAGGRGGRGGRWRAPFYPYQHYPPPFNPFFFPGYGFDPYQPGGISDRRQEGNPKGSSSQEFKIQPQPRKVRGAQNPPRGGGGRGSCTR
jgi:hypothetical protein